MASSPDHDQSDQGDHIEDILPAFWDWLKVQDIKWRVDAERKKIHSSRSAAAQDVLPQRGSAVARRICLSLVLCVISILGALTWQYSNEATRYIVTNWKVSLTSPSSVLNAKSPINSDLQTAPSKRSESPATRSSAELQHQLDGMANDILAVGRIVDRLAARQQQMAQAITMLQFTERNVIEGLSSLPRSATGRSVQHGQRIVQSEGIAQPTPGLNRSRPAPTSLPLR